MYLILFIAFRIKPKDEKFDIFMHLKTQDLLLKKRSTLEHKKNSDITLNINRPKKEIYQFH